MLTTVADNEDIGILSSKREFSITSNSKWQSVGSSSLPKKDAAIGISGYLEREGVVRVPLFFFFFPFFLFETVLNPTSPSGLMLGGIGSGSKGGLVPKADLPPMNHQPEYVADEK